jgi:hypothetical protein
LLSAYPKDPGVELLTVEITCGNSASPDVELVIRIGTSKTQGNNKVKAITSGITVVGIDTPKKTTPLVTP